MKRFNSILCVLDPDNSSDTALIQSMKIASDHQADITIASVSGAENLRKKDKHNKNFDESGEKKRAEIESRISKISPSLKAKIEIYSDTGFIQIIKSTVKNQHDLVVKCAEDPDWLSRIFGSDDMHLLRKCPCPVLMLKPGKNDNFRNILATVDVNDDFTEIDKKCVQESLNRQVLEYTATLCMPELTAFHIGSVWEAFAEDFYRHGAFSRLPEDKIDQYVEQVRRECSNKMGMLVKNMDDMLGKKAMQHLLPRVHLVKGKPSIEIPLMAEKYGIDLIVMGTVGRIGVPGLIIGNTAESILEKARCSVLAIKPEGFKTPVV